MAKQFISQLGSDESVDDVFLAGDKQLRTNRNGGQFIQVELSDRSGTLPARMWNATERSFHSFDDGDFVQVRGNTQIYQGAMQMIATHIARVDPAEVDAADFVEHTPFAIDDLIAEMTEMVAAIDDDELRAIGQSVLADDVLMAKLRRAPAGIKHHHAYEGGLLEHVVSLMRLVRVVAPSYPQVDADMVVLGALLHDLGKVDELSYDRGYAYTDEGQLLGHVTIVISMVDHMLASVSATRGQPVEAEKVLRLKHVILSHHGRYEFGSPKLPMTLEAVMLHSLDNMDAQIHGFDGLMRAEASVEGNWTQYHHNLGRKLFKGGGGAS
ncbi:MAG: OB-fold nucleic acid binding domain-containing protein [Pirellulales bacterium]